jgi:hypothetical protein
MRITALERQQAPCGAELSRRKSFNGISVSSGYVRSLNARFAPDLRYSHPDGRY